jgi:hypothetical protein
LEKHEEKLRAKFDNETPILNQKIEKIKDQNIFATSFPWKIEILSENIKAHFR